MIRSLATDVNDATLKTITDLEQDLGTTLLAYKCHDLKPSTLSEEQLQKIRKIEKDLGVSLVAVEG